MAIDSVDTLLAVLRRVQLLTPEQADEVTRELGPYYTEPQALADYLVEIEWLTGYQRDLLFGDRWDELTLGHYHILDRLGEGGVSEVFKAWDTQKGSVVALKVLRQHLVTESDAVRQLRRELQAITRLSHPNIIKTFDAHHVGVRHYFAMEWVDGVDLHRYVRDFGPLPLAQACEYMRQVAQGLQHAHQIGLVHRDVKPANLFLINPPLPEKPTPPGRLPPEPVVKILDWGLARVKLGPGETFDPSGSDLDMEKGMLIGTADYISPEQAREATLVDIRGDIYSLGCAFYYLLTGQPPFPGTSLMQKLMQHQEAEPPDVRAIRPDVPEEVAVIIQRMMAKKPDDRQQIPLLVVAALRRFCPAAASANGTVIRPSASANGSGLRPTASANGTGVRPAVSANGTALRPGTSASHNGNGYKPGSSSDVPAPGTNGHGTTRYGK